MTTRLRHRHDQQTSNARDLVGTVEDPVVVAWANATLDSYAEGRQDAHRPFASREAYTGPLTRGGDATVTFEPGGSLLTLTVTATFQFGDGSSQPLTRSVDVGVRDPRDVIDTIRRQAA